MATWIGLGVMGVVCAGDFRVLECGKQSLGHCVIPAVAFAAHARHVTVRAHRLAESFTGVLAAAMMEVLQLSPINRMDVVLTVPACTVITS